MAETRRADDEARLLVSTPFGHTEAGAPVQLHTLRNRRGVTVKFLNYGGIVTEILAPDRAGREANIVLGYGSVAEYEAAPAGRYVGALIGRYANRIAGGRFRLDGQDYSLTANEGLNTLHGGTSGFDRRLWTVTLALEADDAPTAMLRYASPDGEEGYPGNLDVTVTYTVNDANEFIIRYRAQTDKVTVINLTHHGYFNLSGVAAGGAIHNHLLMVNAASYIPVDDHLIPLAQPAGVAGTPFDFQTMAAIGARLSADHPQIRLVNGFDHNWVLTKSGNRHEPELAARVHDPASGRILECLTSEPGLQIYTRNVVHGDECPHGAFTLETQHYPDSPHHPDFPNVVLRPDETFESTTIFRFLTDESFHKERI
ncbi:MAG TPA: aldose epimerase family protein [Acidocella sp.]|nr:aldose epimerase family protein [Acidocella sp.]